MRIPGFHQPRASAIFTEGRRAAADPFARQCRHCIQKKRRRRGSAPSRGSRQPRAFRKRVSRCCDYQTSAVGESSARMSGQKSCIFSFTWFGEFKNV